MKDTILRAAIEVVALHGLNNWTVGEVANRAHCAKGLVNYHYRSKRELLQRAAETLRDDRAAHRLAAARGRGSEALDQLWRALVSEVESGWFGAWTSFLTADDPLLHAATLGSDAANAFVTQLGESLGLGDELRSQRALIQAALDGFQLSLLQGRPPAEIEEAYHRFWLVVLA